MLTPHEHINLFFKLLNFCALIGVVVYCFRKYCYRAVLKTLDERAHDHIQQIKLRDQLKQEQLFLEKLMSEETREHQTLMTKIALWQATLEKKEHEHNQQNQQIVKNIYQKQLKQQEYYTYHTMVKEALPRIMEKTKEALMAEYANSRHAHAVLKKIVESLGK
jgi:hypothetical protein